MKALIQRVSKGSVSIDGKITGSINEGYVILLGVRNGDTEDDVQQLAKKTVDLRVCADETKRMNLSIEDIQGEVLIISQFTLYADTSKGNRPSFTTSAYPDYAEKLYNSYVDTIRTALGDSRVATGTFGAMMSVEIINDGPVTIELSTDN